MTQTLKKMAAMLGEALFASVPFGNTTQCVALTWRADRRNTLRKLLIAIRSPAAGAPSPGVCRVIGYVGEPPDDLAFDGSGSTMQLETVPGAQGRKFIDTFVVTADVIGPQDLPLCFPVNVGDVLTIIVSPIHGTSAGANFAAMVGATLLGDAADDGQVMRL